MNLGLKQWIQKTVSSSKMYFYVLDTSVLLYDPNSLTAYKDSHVVVPKAVLKELDRKKNKPGDVGKNARVAISALTDYLHKSLEEGVNFTEGVECKDHSGTVRVMNETLDDVPESLDKEDADNRILSIALTLRKQYPDSEITLVTKDKALGLIAAVYGVSIDDYSSFSSVRRADAYHGFIVKTDYDEAIVSQLWESGHAPLPGNYDLYANSFVVFKNINGEEDTLARVEGEELILCTTIDRYKTCEASGIKPLNHEQYFVLKLLEDPDIELVTLNGPAGTGKSLLVLASALSQVGSGYQYNKIIFARSLAPLGGQDRIGFLKGSLEEKLAPWTQPVIDVLNVLMGKPEKDDFTKTVGNTSCTPYKYLIESGTLEICALQYIRGRTIVDSFVIIDECQNITKNEIKTIITRLGQNSKIILIGDTNQIDAHYLSKSDNALAHTIEAFKDSPRAGHITLVESVRSALAQEAVERL